jgi:hypothetical protein
MSILGRAALAAVSLWIVAVTVSRLVALASGSPARDGAGELRFSRWADRDPPLVGRLEAAGRRLAPGEAVLPVCVPVCDASWYSAMAWYALPRQAVLPAKTAGELGPLHPTLVERSPAEVVIAPPSRRRWGVDGSP